jgi:shikimate kinase
VRDIWLADGEAVYRDMETEVLREALAREEPAVVAAAGGVVLRAANRTLLEGPGVCTVRLSAPPELLVGRVGHQGHRPLLDDDALGTLRRLTEEREPLYEEVATTTIDVAGRCITDVTGLVLDALARCEGR